MPLFVFVSGYLSKNIIKDGRFRADRYFRTLWLYVVFRIVYKLVAVSFGQGEWQTMNLLRITQASWYLLALSSWYLLTPLLLSMKPAVAVAVAAAAGLLSGYTDEFGNFLASSRTIVFLPFFAFGLHLSEESLRRFLSHKWRLPAALLLLAVLGGMYAVRKDFPRIGWVTHGEESYAETLGELAPYGALIRLLLYLLAVLISLGVMLLIPRGKTWFSYVGQNSLAVYILHILIRNVMRFAGIFDRIRELPGPAMLLAIPASILCALVLGHPFFGRLVDWVANPFKNIKSRIKQV